MHYFFLNLNVVVHHVRIGYSNSLRPSPKDFDIACRIQVWHVSVTYCWWTKSWTTKDDNHPIIYRVLTIPGGAGFRPSTVSVISQPPLLWRRPVHYRCNHQQRNRWREDPPTSHLTNNESTRKFPGRFFVFPRKRPFWRNLNLAKRIDTVCIYVYIYTEFQEIWISKKSKVKRFTILRCEFLETCGENRSSNRSNSYDSGFDRYPFRSTFLTPFRSHQRVASFFSTLIGSNPRGGATRFDSPEGHSTHKGKPCIQIRWETHPWHRCTIHKHFSSFPFSKKKQTNSLQNLRWLHHEANHISYGRNYLFGENAITFCGGSLSVIRVLDVQGINIKTEACDLQWFAKWSRIEREQAKMCEFLLTANADNQKIFECALVHLGYTYYRHLMKTWTLWVKLWHLNEKEDRIFFGPQEGQQTMNFELWSKPFLPQSGM